MREKEGRKKRGVGDRLYSCDRKHTRRRRRRKRSVIYHKLPVIKQKANSRVLRLVIPYELTKTKKNCLPHAKVCFAVWVSERVRRIVSVCLSLHTFMSE